MILHQKSRTIPLQFGEVYGNYDVSILTIVQIIQ